MGAQANDPDGGASSAEGLECLGLAEAAMNR
jgi:hypothetical protein